MNTYAQPSTARIAAALVRGLVHRGAAYARRTVEYSIERRRMERIRRHGAEPAALLRRAKRILIVCHGNIIRSAFAARLLADALADRPVSVASGGLEAVPGGSAHPLAISIAGNFGVDLAEHVSSRVGSQAVASADLILVMDVRQLMVIRRRFPDAAPRTFLLTCLSPDGPLEIRDPVYGDAPVFKRCFHDIERAMRPIVAMLSGDGARAEAEVHG